MYEETLKRDFQSTAPADESVLPLDDSILASWVRSICQTGVFGFYGGKELINHPSPNS